MPKKKRRFEWDSGNVLHLWQRHQVRPFEAEEALNDPNLVGIPDESHSIVEIRFGAIGKTRKNRVLFLAFTIRQGHIRVFHARNANKKEVKSYEKEASNT